MRRSLASRIVTGLFIIAFGIAILGQVAHLWDLGNLADSWWTLFLIVPGIASIVSIGFRFWNVFLVFLGGWLLAENQGWLGVNAWLFFLGGFLVVFGVWTIIGGSHHHPYHESSDTGNRNFNADNNDCPEYASIFSDSNLSNKSSNFKGGKATSVFGRLTVDLRDIQISGHAFVEVASVFGSLEILVPKNVPVKVGIVPVFGGFNNSASTQPPTPGQPYLEIKGASVFGSIRIL